LRPDAATATPVGRAFNVVASHDGGGLWLWAQRDGRPCSLREVGLDGRQRRPARRVDCDTQPLATPTSACWSRPRARAPTSR
jgi:hypothetical protein